MATFVGMKEQGVRSKEQAVANEAPQPAEPVKESRKDKKK